MSVINDGPGGFLWAGITVLFLATNFPDLQWWGELQARQEVQMQTKAANEAFCARSVSSL
jgi:hypothetical protein